MMKRKEQRVYRINKTGEYSEINIQITPQAVLVTILTGLIAVPLIQPLP